MYYENSELFARDLQEAAEEGQATGDYSRYHAVQKQLAAETAAAMLSPYAGVLSALARDRALKEAESRHPGFTELLNENRDSLKKERPALDNAIAYAEQDPRLQQDLLQLYESANDYLRVQRAGNAGSQSQSTTSEEPDSLEAINTLPPEQRRAHLEALGERFRDVSVDLADDSAEAKSITRY